MTIFTGRSPYALWDWVDSEVANEANPRSGSSGTVRAGQLSRDLCWRVDATGFPRCSLGLGCVGQFRRVIACTLVLLCGLQCVMLTDYDVPVPVDKQITESEM